MSLPVAIIGIHASRCAACIVEEGKDWKRLYHVTDLLLRANSGRSTSELQGCHKLGFYPGSRIFNTYQSYSDGFVEVFGFLALGADANRHLHTRVYARTYV